MLYEKVRGVQLYVEERQCELQQAEVLRWNCTYGVNVTERNNTLHFGISLWQE